MEARERDEFVALVARMGGTATAARDILRHARLLQRWAEEGCGDSNAYASWAREDCEVCGGEHMRIYPNDSNATRWRHGERCEQDRQRFAGKRAQERIEALAAEFGARVEFQGDPRGCCVKLVLPGQREGRGVPA